jgi:hypothetical protein
MPLASLDNLTVVNQAEISSDPPTSLRKGQWYKHLEAVLDKYVGGEVQSDKFVKLADFDNPAGARVKMKDLLKRPLPGEDEGTWYFIHNTWLDDKQERHSSLFGRYALGDVVDPDEDEEPVVAAVEPAAEQWEYDPTTVA